MNSLCNNVEYFSESTPFTNTTSPFLPQTCNHKSMAYSFNDYCIALCNLCFMPLEVEYTDQPQTMTRGGSY